MRFSSSVAVRFGAGTAVPDIKPGPTWVFSASRIGTFGRIEVTHEVRSASYSGVGPSAPGEPDRRPCTELAGRLAG